MEFVFEIMPTGMSRMLDAVWQNLPIAPSTKMTHQLSLQVTWLVQNGYNIKTTHVAKLPFANNDVMDLSKTHLIWVSNSQQTVADWIKSASN